MGGFLIKVLAWAFYGVLFAGLIVFVICTVRGFGSLFKSQERIKVYYDDNDQSKGYYYVGKPGDTYPIGYPKGKIVKDMEAYEQLKRKQKARSRGGNIEEAGSLQKKPHPMWLQILLMTPAEYMQYRRLEKEAKQR